MPTLPLPVALQVSATPTPGSVRGPDGALLAVPDGWALLPPGDAGLTRRVKAAGPTWTMVEKKGRKTFSRGMWAPAAHIEAARSALLTERAAPSYAKKLLAASRRRDEAQSEYEGEFEQRVRAYLAFGPSFAAEEAAMALLVTRHATPVGSGTVARTRRIPVEERAEAAVIAWMRHQTTAYDSIAIPRVKGKRREVRRELARVSVRLLSAHRTPGQHPPGCPLCRALPKVPPGGLTRPGEGANLAAGGLES